MAYDRVVSAAVVDAVAIVDNHVRDGSRENTREWGLELDARIVCIDIVKILFADNAFEGKEGDTLCMCAACLPRSAETHGVSITQVLFSSGP